MLTVNCREWPSRAIYNNGGCFKVVHLVKLPHDSKPPLSPTKIFSIPYNAFLLFNLTFNFFPNVPELPFPSSVAKGSRKKIHVFMVRLRGWECRWGDHGPFGGFPKNHLYCPAFAMFWSPPDSGVPESPLIRIWKSHPSPRTRKHWSTRLWPWEDQPGGRIIILCVGSWWWWWGSWQFHIQFLFIYILVWRLRWNEVVKIVHQIIDVQLVGVMVRSRWNFVLQLSLDL